ncbi:peptidoglycan endopeptidase LytE [Alicyclobacillus sacchari]|uniref:Peptidoglycan endopeptidase LytE n=1 Tax=Alicyclobacillus sacchari TaxID=392010 RepID=A0A4R8LW56_9BACL|nr:C40 family peptidase [Alicyclobacillus sacchari]TDY51027.1 peptidoglycan endopeptidase LytE [Alicyclobacillus sacchari]
MRKGIIAVVTTIATLAAPGMGVAFAGTSSSAAAYTVQTGDTMYKIALAKDVPLASLELANPQIQNPTSIYPGEVIALPTPYVVASGDTLYKIAVAHGISLAALEAANPQITDVTNLQIGQTIFLPIPANHSTTLTSTPASASSASVNAAPGAGSSTVSTPSTAAQTTSGSTSSTAVLRQNILNFAQSLVGIHYAWGGSSPTTGFDCSGFVQYVFAHFDISLPRQSHDQATVGTPVAQSSLQPGDLLFFTDTDSYASQYANHVTHVGIYMGNGNMIESSSANNGEGVVVVHNVFANPYYSAHYYGARDVIG